MNSLEVTEDQDPPEADWEVFIQRIAQMILQEQTPARYVLPLRPALSTWGMISIPLNFRAWTGIIAVLFHPLPALLTIGVH